MTTITATTAAESEAAIANLKIGDVIKVPGNRTRVTVTSIQRLFGCTTVIHTTGKTEDGGKLWADDMTGGFYFEAVYKKINHFRTFEIVADQPLPHLRDRRRLNPARFRRFDSGTGHPQPAARHDRETTP